MPPVSWVLIDIKNDRVVYKTAFMSGAFAMREFTPFIQAYEEGNSTSITDLRMVQLGKSTELQPVKLLNRFEFREGTAT